MPGVNVATQEKYNLVSRPTTLAVGSRDLAFCVRLAAAAVDIFIRWHLGNRALSPLPQATAGTLDMVL
jgi:hypothetical protein